MNDKSIQIKTYMESNPKATKREVMRKFYISLNTLFKIAKENDIKFVKPVGGGWMKKSPLGRLSK